MVTRRKGKYTVARTAAGSLNCDGSGNRDRALIRNHAYRDVDSVDRVADSTATWRRRFRRRNDEYAVPTPVYDGGTRYTNCWIKHVVVV